MLVQPDILFTTHVKCMFCPYRFGHQGTPGAPLVNFYGAEDLPAAPFKMKVK